MEIGQGSGAQRPKKLLGGAHERSLHGSGGGFGSFDQAARHDGKGLRLADRVSHSVVLDTSQTARLGTGGHPGELQGSGALPTVVGRQHQAGTRGGKRRKRRAGPGVGCHVEGAGAIRQQQGDVGEPKVGDELQVVGDVRQVPLHSLGKRLSEFCNSHARSIRMRPACHADRPRTERGGRDGARG